VYVSVGTELWVSATGDVIRLIVEIVGIPDEVSLSMCLGLWHVAKTVHAHVYVAHEDA
jgi:hypothetical protein